MKTVKHVGKIKNTGTRVAVVFRTIPGESDKCLVVDVATLPDSYHDSLMTLIETEQAQDAFELGEIMFIRPFPNGLNMLAALGEENRLKKMPTDSVLMTPTPVTEIPLDQLNVLIAEQKNCTVDELCNFVSGASLSSSKSEDKNVTEVQILPTPLEARENVILDDKDLAKSYRSQADALYKEAARLRKQAEELDPIAKKTAKVKEEEGAV
jgi:hypothetical protein